MADVFERLKKGEPAPVYVLCSKEPLLVDRAVTAIRDAAVPPNKRGFNLEGFDGKGLTAARVLAAAQTLPMMAERRMVLVRDITAMPAAELSGLVDYVANPNPTTVLVALCAKRDGRLKFFSVAKKAGFVHELAAPRRVTGWIRDEARARGVKMSSGAIGRLEDVVGNDLSRLSVAIEQLGLYAGERGVEVDDVDDLIADTRERTVFELTDAIGARDVPRALAAVAALFEQRQSSIGVVMMLARNMRQVAVCHGAIADGVPKSELARTVGVPPFVVDKLARQAGRYSADALAIAFRKLSTADGALKGQAPMTKTLGRQLGERVVVDRLVSDLISLSR